MGKWLFLIILMQLACAVCAARLDRPTIWLQGILLVPLFGSLAYCRFEIMRALRRVGSSRPADIHSAATPAEAKLGRLGYQAVRARTADSRRALAEECMRIGRHADAKLLFQSCMVGRYANDPRLIEGLNQATARLSMRSLPEGAADRSGTSIAL